MSVNGGPTVDPLQMLGLHGYDTVLMLQYTLDEQERLPDDRHPLAIEEVRADDDVGDAGLVLERQEDKAFRGAGTLARDDHARDADAPAVARLREVDRAQDASQRKIIASQ